MRHGLLLNGLIAALAAVLSLASPWAAGARADAAQVTVVSPGGAQQTLSLDALTGSEDVLNRSYALRSVTGESALPVTGFSLAAILAAAGADPYGFSYLEVQRPAGGTVLLSHDQALDADNPPAIYASTAGTGFVRPSAGPDDLNAGDSFEAPQGISLVLHKGSRLQIRAKASTQRTRPGHPVHFSAIIERAGSGEQLTYSWYFDDGGSATSSEATHSFAKPGSYDVVLGVTSEGDDTGASAVVTVQVGEPIAGPDRKGGGRNDSAAAPDHGAAVGPLPAGTPRRTGCTPADAQHGRRPCVRRGATGPPAPKPERKPSPGQRVVGELVSATTDTTASSAKQAAARSGHLDGGGGGGIPGAAWGVLATLGLLGAGALAEAGGLARLWPRGGAA
jgi:PKD domain